MQTQVVAHQRWESGQLAVEPDDRLSFCRKYALWVVRGVGRDVFNLLICLLLDAVAAPVDIRRAHKQKQRQTDKRQHQNSQQPRGGTGRAAAFGHEADGNNLDAVIQD